MTNWEYKTVNRTRGWHTATEPRDATWKIAGDWDVDIDKVLKELGDKGWELVAVTSRSSYAGGYREGTAFVNYMTDYAGFTDGETWIFKRPKSG